MISITDEIRTSRQTDDTDEHADLVLERARRLFEFLALVEEQRSQPVRSIATYGSRGGQILWLHEMSNHEAVASAHRVAQPDPGEPALIIHRVPPTDPPSPGERLRDWIAAEDLSDWRSKPTLREVVSLSEVDEHGEEATVTYHIDDHPEIARAFDEWREGWQAWAEHEEAKQPVKDLYERVFRIGEEAAGAPEELEVVLGMGLLAWNPDDHDAVRRHLLTVPAQVVFDDDTGQILVRPEDDVEGLTLELDMLDSTHWPDRERIAAVRNDADQFEAHPLDRDKVGLLLQRLVYPLRHDAHYTDDDEPVGAGSRPRVVFAPALVLRRRSKRARLRVMERIRDQLTATEEVPDGIRQLVDLVEDNRLPTDPEPAPSMDQRRAGTGGSQYLPLPANDQQRKIIDRVDTRAHTVVQGPPGTGKTHTIANLLSHLLARGQRVLVTAYTDRALYELRDKLPEPLSALCVSAVGQDRSDLADLRVAIQELSSRAHSHDPKETRNRIEHLEQQIHELERKRSRLQSRLVEIQEADTLVREEFGYHGTLAEITEEHAGEAECHGWLEEFDPQADEPPLDDAQAMRWLELLRDEGIHRHEAQAMQDIAPLTNLLSPDEFANLVEAAAEAASEAEQHEEIRQHQAYDAVAALSPTQRTELNERMEGLASAAAALAERDEAWMSDALRDVYGGRADLWRHRCEKLTEVLSSCRTHLEAVGTTTQITVETEDVDALIPQAERLREHVAAGGKLDGLIFTPRPVKDASEFLGVVRVDGVEPTSVEALEAFLRWAQAARQLDIAEELWPRDVVIPDEDTLEERWAWNHTETRQLERVIDLAAGLRDQRSYLDGLEIPSPEWSDLEQVRCFGQLVEAATAEDRRREAEQPLRELEDALHQTTRWEDAAPVMNELHEAVAARDPERYRTGHQRLANLNEVRDRCEYRERLETEIGLVTDGLVEAVRASVDDEVWGDRLAHLRDAWQWCRAARWIDEEVSTDVDALQRRMAGVEQRLRDHVTELTAARAWDEAVDRLGVREQQALKSYSLAVKQLGKGTGKYAPHRRREAREALKQCRGAVPAWIMPLYRVEETLEVDRDVFDVVIIDEASQAGVEASYLQYLAPRLVVVGDDKQVSPSGVGIDRQQLIDLRKQFLYDLDHAYTWENPETSFFDQARLRSPDVITLREHFRCVPEIIGFSNRIAYEPENVPLIPLRQYGAERLDPVRTVFVDDGYTQGTRNKINPPEVERVVDAVLKCCADPVYDDKTMGVISLTGSAQATEIERRLLEEMNPKEYRARELRCGDAAAFQGSERDVMFLSMVAAYEPGERLYPLTRDMFVQRFNVAASRAKDQMWVFHSIRPAQFDNKEGMRFQLLDYCYGVERRQGEEGEQRGRVPEDMPVSPFESLFEQRVYNRIYDRGYHVIPQWEIYDWRIDLVVIGAHGRIAIECDGDRWHGADRYEHDLKRQRELERCGWTFFRVRSSAFYRDPRAALEPLWRLLDERDIHPMDWKPERQEPKDDDPARFEPAQTAPDTSPSDMPARIRSAAEEPELGYRVGEEGAVDQGETQPTAPERPPRRAPSASEKQPLERGRGSTEVQGCGLRLQPYTQWEANGQPFVHPHEASQDELGEGLRRIAEVEGPLTGERLYALYVKSSGGSRVGAKIRRILNKASFAAEQNDLLVTSNPLGRPGQQVKTFRVQGQPEVLLRELGPRTLHEVPDGELAAVLEHFADDALDREAWFRSVLDLYGLTQLSSKARETLEEAALLVGFGPSGVADA